jgi:repressor LexA
MSAPSKKPNRFPAADYLAAQTKAKGAMNDAAEGAETLTERQVALYEAIVDAVKTQGYPPSMRELGVAAGLTSPSSVLYQLKVLETKGYIRRDPNRPRAIEINLGTDYNEAPQSQSLNTVQVPLVGRIAAGAPILAQEHVEDILTLPTTLVGTGTLFALEVHGDSMIDAAICDGDTVIVRQQADANNGEIVAALLDDEATVKTFKREPGQVWLLPQNPAYSPIDGNHASIMGKVVAVLRRL